MASAVPTGGNGGLRHRRVAFVEALVSRTSNDTTPWLFEAIFAGSVFWIAGATIGAMALLAWAIRRGLGANPPPDPVKTPLPLTRVVRLRGWGFIIVAG